MPTWDIDNFNGGLDVRKGSWSRRQNRYREFTNCYVDDGGHVLRRHPLKLNAGTFGTDTSAMIEKDGISYTLAPKGGGLTVPVGVTALAYDVPVGTLSSSLIDVVALNNVPVALLKHTYASGVWIYALHVFDGATDQLTLVMDPAFPWSSKLSPSARPALGTAAGKVYCSGPEGDTYFSGVGKPRVWNLRTVDTISASGFDFFFYLPASGAQAVTIPLDVDLVGTLLNSGYTGAVLQRWFAGADGTPTDDTLFGSDTLASGFSLTQASGAPAVGQFLLNAGGVVNTALKRTYSFWASYTVNATAAGFYRLRVLAPVDSEVGYRTNDTLTGPFVGMHTLAGPVQPLYTVFGDAATKQFPLPDTFTFANAAGLWQVKVDGVVQAWPAAYTVLQADDGTCKVSFVAAPANKSLIEVSERFYSVATGFDIAVPKHQLRTFGGTKDFPGGTIALPPSTTAGTVGIALDKSGLPGLLTVYTSNDQTNQYKQVMLFQFTTDGVGIVSLSYTHGEVNRTAANIIELYRDARGRAGSLDAGFLPTSKHPSGGGLVTDLTGAKNRLLVRYKSGGQLWNVFADPTQDSISSLIPIGSGDQPASHGVLFFRQTVIVPCDTGLRAVSLTGGIDESLHEDENIGGAVSKLGAIVFQAATFWPEKSCYVAAVTIDGTFALLVLHYHDGDDTKIVAWSRWTFTGLTSVDPRGLSASGGRLKIRSGTSLFYLDGDAVIGSGQFYDYNETAATGYEEKIVGYFNDFKAPMAEKHATELDVLQIGKATYSFRVNPYQEANETAGIVITGTTRGRPKVPLCARGMGLALVMRSTDANGHELHGVSAMYRVIRR